MNWSGRVILYLRIAGHLALAALKVAVCFRFWPQKRREAEVSQWAMKTLSIFRIRLVVAGKRRIDSPCLIVANHVSWLDIYALLSQSHASFVAKAEVRRWPLIGWLAERVGTVFVLRQRHRRVAAEVREIVTRLEAGTSVGLFPEGTTTVGNAPTAFRPLYFEAAIVAGTPVQPVAIRYLGDDGALAEDAAFTGDMTLVESFVRLANGRASVVELTYLEPIDSPGTCRRRLATAAESAIRLALAGNAGASGSGGETVVRPARRNVAHPAAALPMQSATDQ